MTNGGDDADADADAEEITIEHETVSKVQDHKHTELSERREHGGLTGSDAADSDHDEGDD